jgi:hypothetical protein
MSAKSSRPAPSVPTGGMQPTGVQVDIGRVLQRYRDALGQATERAMIAEAGQEQLLEENGSLRARIAELEAQVAAPTAE